MKVTIREFRFEDIPLKISWINNPENNQFLHYDLPLEYEKTCIWFEKNKGRADRYDAVIEVNGTPVGLIGLLSIDRKNQKAEYYVSMGETRLKGHGVASKASNLLLEYAFRYMKLEKVYLYTETGNAIAQKLFERVGFKKEGILKHDLISRGMFVDRIAYGITKAEYLLSHGMTPITFLGDEFSNRLFIKRDDLIPYSFGGNKARKGFMFFQEIDAGNYDCVVTYGSSHSNHCRIVANMAAARNMKCYIVGPEEISDLTYNSRFMDLFGAEITTVPVKQVHDTIENKMHELRSEGHNPYFIPGGGHGNLGTEAYIQCYDEIRAYEQDHGTHFDYIFFASGTGTTHAGLVCGQLMNKDERMTVGISIARKNPRGRQVIIDSIHEYLASNNVSVSDDQIEAATIFDDSYTGRGYAKEDDEIKETIRDVLTKYGLPLDSTYTGKAFHGMREYLKEKNVTDKKILFIHTGGTPLFFDDLGGKL